VTLRRFLSLSWRDQTSWLAFRVALWLNRKIIRLGLRLRAR
jgi:hypothetical protein